MPCYTRAPTWTSCLLHASIHNQQRAALCFAKIKESRGEPERETEVFSMKHLGASGQSMRAKRGLRRNKQEAKDTPHTPESCRHSEDRLQHACRADITQIRSCTNWLGSSGHERRPRSFRSHEACTSLACGSRLVYPVHDSTYGWRGTHRAADAVVDSCLAASSPLPQSRNRS